MAITDDQRAMLQLLLGGGQSYEDIASLLGNEPGEVRSRARAALTEMGGADPDADVGLTDYLLGQADPIGRADAVRRLQGDPDTNALANRLLAQLRLLSPSADLPQLPEAKGGRRGRPAAAPTPSAPVAATSAPVGAPAPAASAPIGAPAASQPSAATPAATPASTPGTGLSGRLGGLNSKIVAAGGLLGLLLIVGILAIAGVFSGGDDSSSGGSGDCPVLDTSAAASSGVPAVALAAAPDAPANGDCKPVGQAVFASAQSGKQQQVVLQTNAVNLAPTTSGQTYIIWLYRSDDFAFPLAQNPVTDSGDLAGPAPIPTQVVQVLGAFGEIRISLASEAEARSALQNTTSKGGLPKYIGTTVLSGPLPSSLTQGSGGSGSSGSSGSGGSGKGAKKGAGKK